MSDGFLSPATSSAIAFGGGGFLVYNYTKYKTVATVLMVLGGLSALGAVTKTPNGTTVSGTKRDLLIESKYVFRNPK